MIIALSFLVISTALVGTLIHALIKLINTDWDKEAFSGKAVLKVFKWPIVSFLALIIFISFILPILDKAG